MDIDLVQNLDRHTGTQCANVACSVRFQAPHEHPVLCAGCFAEYTSQVTAVPLPVRRATIPELLSVNTSIDVVGEAPGQPEPSLRAVNRDPMRRRPGESQDAMMARIVDSGLLTSRLSAAMNNEMRPGGLLAALTGFEATPVQTSRRQQVLDEARLSDDKCRALRFVNNSSREERSWQLRCRPVYDIDSPHGRPVLVSYSVTGFPETHAERTWEFHKVRTRRVRPDWAVRSASADVASFCAWAGMPLEELPVFYWGWSRPALNAPDRAYSRFVVPRLGFSLADWRRELCVFVRYLIDAEMLPLSDGVWDAPVLGASGRTIVVDETTGMVLCAADGVVRELGRVDRVFLGEWAEDILLEFEGFLGRLFETEKVVPGTIALCLECSGTSGTPHEHFFSFSWDNLPAMMCTNCCKITVLPLLMQTCSAVEEFLHLPEDEYHGIVKDAVERYCLSEGRQLDIDIDALGIVRMHHAQTGALVSEQHIDGVLRGSTEARMSVLHTIRERLSVPFPFPTGNTRCPYCERVPGTWRRDIRWTKGVQVVCTHCRSVFAVASGDYGAYECNLYRQGELRGLGSEVTPTGRGPLDSVRTYTVDKSSGVFDALWLATLGLEASERGLMVNGAVADAVAPIDGKLLHMESFVADVYNPEVSSLTFGVSARPDKFVGVWDATELDLTEALQARARRHVVSVLEKDICIYKHKVSKIKYLRLRDACVCLGKEVATVLAEAVDALDEWGVSVGPDGIWVESIVVPGALSFEPSDLQIYFRVPPSAAGVTSRSRKAVFELTTNLLLGTASQLARGYNQGDSTQRVCVRSECPEFDVESLGVGKTYTLLYRTTELVNVVPSNTWYCPLCGSPIVKLTGKSSKSSCDVCAAIYELSSVDATVAQFVGFLPYIVKTPTYRAKELGGIPMRRLWL